jgi:hypothetical protein
VARAHQRRLTKSRRQIGLAPVRRACLVFVSETFQPWRFQVVDNSNKNAANSQFRKLRQAEEGKRAMLDYENNAAAMRVKTTRLRALRLARDAEEAAAAAAAPPVKKKAAKKEKI